MSEHRVHREREQRAVAEYERIVNPARQAHNQARIQAKIQYDEYLAPYRLAHREAKQRAEEAYAKIMDQEGESRGNEEDHHS